jgi:hypothetical protein
MELLEVYDELEEDDAAGKGGKLRLTVEAARRIAQDVIERRDRMARKRNAEAEIDDLVDDDLEDLDELEDEDEETVETEAEEEEEEEEEEDEDPDEAPKARRRSKKTRAKKTTSKKTKTVKEGVGTSELAEAAGVEPRQLRAYLRSSEIQPREDRDGRYWWPSLNDKGAQRIIKEVRGGAVDRMNKEKLANLKKGKKTTAKKSTRKRARTSK